MTGCFNSDEQQATCHSEGKNVFESDNFVLSETDMDTVGVYSSENLSEESKGVYLVSEVNQKIDALIESAEYKQANIQTRKEYAQSLLEEMEDEKLIRNYKYFEESYMFSFNYENGIIGGIYLLDFANDGDLLPMN